MSDLRFFCFVVSRLRKVASYVFSMWLDRILHVLVKEWGFVCFIFCFLVLLFIDRIYFYIRDTERFYLPVNTSLWDLEEKGFVYVPSS